MVRYAQCCQPVPGDAVVGYVTQGRGISIHRADCPNLLTLSADERRVDIDWQETAGRGVSPCGWRSAARTGADCTPTSWRRSARPAPTSAAPTSTRKDGSVFGTIFVEVDNLPHLAKVLKAVRRVKGVTEIERREAPPT